MSALTSTRTTTSRVAVSLLPLTVIAVLTVALVRLSMGGVVLAAVGLGIAVLVVAVTVLGLRVTGLLVLGLSFFLAAGSRAAALAVAGPSLSASDALFALALLLLLPSLVANGLPRVALLPVFGLAMMFPTFLVATALYSESVPGSVLTISAFAVSTVLIPATLIALRPSPRVLQALAWSYISAHLLDVAYSVVKDPTTGIRHQGITQHPNALGQAGMLSFALLLYLRHSTRRPWLVHAAMLVSLASIYLSGSRGATVGIAAILLVLPVVERTPLSGTVVATIAAFGLLGLKYVAPLAGPDSAIGRLLGNGTSADADVDRQQGLDYGFARFHEHPVVGSGLADVASIHVNLLEIAVGGGVVALAGFLVLAYSLCRPMLSAVPERRLVYTVVALLAFSLTAPALGDRPMWLIASLSIAVFHGFRDPDPSPPPAPSAGSTRSPARTSRPVAAGR